MAVEAPGGQAEGRVWRRRHGVEKEAVGYLCTRSTEEPTLEASTCTGERAPLVPVTEEKSFHLEALIQNILGKRASQNLFKKTGASQSEVTPATGSDLQRSTFRMCVQLRMCTGSLRSEDTQGLVLQLQASRLFSRPARPTHTCCWREAQSEKALLPSL